MGRFDDWSKEDLANYLEFLMHSYRVVDAFWFLNIEERHGHREACRVNELVWGKAGELAARDLKARFGLDRGGLKGFVELLKKFPWTILVGYEFDVRDDQVVITVPDCPPQTARLKRGLGEYDCAAMHMAEFRAVARIADPGIEVICDHAPPDPHPPERFCRWRFRMKH